MSCSGTQHRCWPQEHTCASLDHCPPCCPGEVVGMFGLFRMPRFIRRFIRRRTAKMPASRALEVKEKLSIAYAFVAWNLLGVFAYKVYTGRWAKVENEEPELSVGRQFVKMLNLKNVHLTHIKGVSSVQHYDLTEEEGFGTEEVKKDKEVLEE